MEWKSKAHAVLDPSINGGTFHDYFNAIVSELKE